MASLARNLCQRRCGTLPHPRLPSGLTPLDKILDGGFAVGAVHELIAADAGAAVRSLALRTVAPALGGSRWLLYVDTGDDLYPPALPAYGVPLARLLVVRTSRTGEALWVCEEALRCRAIAAIVVPLRQLDAQVSRRLQLAAEAGGGVLFALCRAATRGTFAATRLVVEACVVREQRVGHHVLVTGDHSLATGGYCSVRSAEVINSPLKKCGTGYQPVKNVGEIAGAALPDEAFRRAVKRAVSMDAPALRLGGDHTRPADGAAVQSPILKGGAPVGLSSSSKARDRKEEWHFAPALKVTVLKLRGGCAGQTLTLEWDDAAGVVYPSAAARGAARTA